MNKLHLNQNDKEETNECNHSRYWKVLGAIAILVQGFPRLKEWAYTGIFFDMMGAAAPHVFSSALYNK
ncbi:DoxX family protein [Paenibacillus elgii]|uniref:DoxX family protein n=1 Tax=Paenibacillus elgii TaxID=189691 RepID=UPI0015811012